MRRVMAVSALRRRGLSCRTGFGWPAGPGLPPWSGGQHPGAVPAGQALSDQVAQVQGGGEALEPGVVAGDPPVAELEPPTPPGGDLGDGALHVGPVFHVVLAQPGSRGPVRAGGPEQAVAGVQDELAAGLAGGAPLPQRAVPAQDAEGGDPGAAERHGVPGQAGHRARLLVRGEGSTVNPPGTGACNGLGLITASCPASPIAPRRSPVPQAESPYQASRPLSRSPLSCPPAASARPVPLLSRSRPPPGACWRTSASSASSIR